MELCIIFVSFIACIFIICLVGLVIDTHRNNQKHKKIQNTIDEIKNRLASIDILFNHSLELTNVKTGNVAYFRIYNIYYNYEKNDYFAKAYIFDKDKQLGEWEDEVKYLYSIVINNRIKDCGEWNPNKLA